MKDWSFNGNENKKRKRIIIAGVITAVVVIAVIIGIVFAVKSNGKKTDGDTLTEEELNADPEEVIAKEGEEASGADVDVKKIVAENETDEITIGIDVAKYQGTIDWKKVSDSGIDFAIVRVGYRTLVSGEIVADSNAQYNMQEAQKYGIKVGAYFFSTAVSEAEAIEEANWVADYISKYQITYPVAYNCEGFETVNSRQYSMTKTQRTDVALAFLNRITERDYIGMFYASMNELQAEAKWETTRIETAYKIWVAQYPNAPYPQKEAPDYEGVYAMWQYTNQGTIAGIDKPVDVNVAYFGFDKTAGAQSSETPESVQADPEALMNFQEVNETVTAKEKTNLRNKPSQGSDSSVLFTLSNGETATRTGVSNSGWSRVIYNGKTCYAVSSYLTTDLNYQPPQPEVDTGFKTKFTDVNEQVTAKEEVNLRTMPSVTDAGSQVVATIKNGDVVTRTGVNTELGWSRVEYNGQTLYCISSYLQAAN